MRYLLSLTVICGLTVCQIGCGPTEVADNEEGSDNRGYQEIVGGQGGQGGPSAQGGPSQASTGDSSGGYGGAGAADGDPYADEQPGFAASDDGGYGGADFAGGDPYGGAGGDPNDPSGGYGGAFEEQPGFAGAGNGGEGDYGAGFDPGSAAGQDGGNGGNAGFDNGGGGAGGAGGASAPNDAAPPPPGQGGFSGGNTGGGAGGAGGASAPNDAPPGPDGSYPGGYSGDADQPSFNGSGQFQGNSSANSEPQTLKDYAMKAFREGKEDDAFQYMYAYYLGEDAGAEEHFLGMMSSTNEPRSAVRWGIGVRYIAPTTFTSQPPEIGSQPAGSENGSGGGSPEAGGGGFSDYGGGGYGGGGSAPSAGAERLTYYTGEYGEALLERLEMRRTYDGGFYGNFLSQVEGSGSGNNQQNGSNPYSSGGFSGGSSGAAQLDESFAGPEGGGGGNQRRDDDEEVVIEQIQPGVLYLGEGTDREVIDRAQQHGIDAILMFEVRVTTRGQTKTEASLKLIDGKTRQTVFGQRRPLNNIAVWNYRLENGDDDPEDPIQEALDDVFKDNADEVFKLTSMPELTEEDAKARIEIITSSEVDNPLPLLSEIKYYHVNELIDDETLVAAYTSLIEGNAENLASANEEDRQKAIERWLPGNFDAGGGDEREQRNFR